MMSWTEIRDRWGEFKGKARKTWRRLSARDLAAIQGIRDQLVDKLEDVYGMARSEAESQVRDFARRMKRSARTVSRKARGQGRLALRRAEEAGRAAAGRALSAASRGLDRVRESVEHPKGKRLSGQTHMKVSLRVRHRR